MLTNESRLRSPWLQADVGSKTSVRWTNAAFQGFREQEGEAVIAKWCHEFKKCGHQNELVRLNEKKVGIHNHNTIVYQYRSCTHVPLYCASTLYTFSHTRRR